MTRDQLVDAVRRMARAGHTDRQISERLGGVLSRAGIGHLRRRHGISGPGRRRARTEVLAALANGDYDEVEVIRHLNGDRSIPLHRHDTATPELVEAVRRLTHQHYTDQQISHRLGERLSRDAVQKLRHRYGIPSGVPRPGRAA